MSSNFAKKALSKQAMLDQAVVLSNKTLHVDLDIITLHINKHDFYTAKERIKALKADLQNLEKLINELEN